MSTRSLVGYLDGDILKCIYVHMDGYPEWEGDILSLKYNTTEELLKLLNHSKTKEVRSLTFDLKEVKDLDGGRIRELIALPMKGPDVKQWLDEFFDIEFIYILTKNKWRCVDLIKFKEKIKNGDLTASDILKFSKPHKLKLKNEKIKKYYMKNYNQAILKNSDERPVNPEKNEYEWEI